MKRAFQSSSAPPEIPQRHAQTVLRQHEVCTRLGICDETWRRWWREGRAPAPLAGFPRLRPRWSVQAIEDFERGRGVGLTGRRYFARLRQSA